MRGKSVTGLSNFVSEIRGCSNKDAERKIIETELQNIRARSKEPKLSGKERKNIVWNLVYIDTIGYEYLVNEQDVMNMRHLISSTVYTEKQSGYAACALLFRHSEEIQRSIINTIKQDLSSQNEHFISLALSSLANFGTVDISEALFRDVQSIANVAANAKPYLRRKAYLAMLKLFRQNHDVMPADRWAPRLAMALSNEKNPGALLSLCSVLLGALEHDAPAWVIIFPHAVSAIASVCGNDGTVPMHYYGVSNPWTQIKLLRMIQYFPPPEESHLLKAIMEQLNSIFRNAINQFSVPTAKTKRNVAVVRNKRQNAENAILFEALNVAVHYKRVLDANTKKMVISLLGSLISYRGTNMKCLGLDITARYALEGGITQSLKKHVPSIVENLKESDVSLRRNSLSLLFVVCDQDNWQFIVDQLLECLKTAETFFQEELVLKAAILVERNAPDYTWYIDTTFKMIEFAPEVLYDDIAHRLIQVVTGFGLDQPDQDLQTYAAQKAYDHMNDEYANDVMIRLSSYLLGEFGHFILDEAPARKQLKILHKHFAGCSDPTRSALLVAYTKIASVAPEIEDDVRIILEENTHSADEEIQQRAIELLALLRLEDKNLIESVFCMMPTFPEEIQQHNPLIGRMKRSPNRPRATTRRQLDELTTTSGNLLPRTAGRRPANFTETTKLTDGPPLNRAPVARQEPNRYQDEQSEEVSEESEETTSSSELEESDSGSSSHSKDSDASSHELELAPVRPGDTRGLWKRLCVVDKGPLLETRYLRLRLDQTYNSHSGVINIAFAGGDSTMNSTIILHSVSIEETSALKVACTKTVQDEVISPGKSFSLKIGVRCLSPFLNPVPVRIDFSFVVDGQTTRKNLSLFLPVTVSKFIVPAKLHANSFKKYWDKIGDKETATSGFALPSFRELNAFKALLKAFNMNCTLIGSALCASGTLNTATPTKQNPEKTVCVATMARIVYNSEQKRIGVSVRAAHEGLASILCRLLSSYLLEPEKQ